MKLTQRSKTVEVLFGLGIGTAIFWAAAIIFSGDAKFGIIDLVFLFLSALISPVLSVLYWEGLLFLSTLVSAIYFLTTRISSPWLRLAVAAWLNTWLLGGVLVLVYLFGWW